jgi:NDP-sugar pyrophosphorylase family protein
MVDCVILAAGRGARLRGVVPQFHKPLMTVDGKAMIVHAVEEARSVPVDKLVIVVAPDNAGPITSLLVDARLLDTDTTIIVQPEPNGPGVAYLLAVDLIACDEVLLLMADNIFGKQDVFRVLHGDANVVVGGRYENDPAIARRFTRVTPSGGTFEGPDINETQEWTASRFFIWLGPLRAPTHRLAQAIGAYGVVGNEFKIGPALGHCGSIGAVECDTHDVGDLNGS